MKRLTLLLYIFIFCLAPAFPKEKTVHLKILETTDVHGNYFPENMIENKPWEGSLARVYGYAETLRKQYGENLILLDNGDILQGQPVAYYYNFIDTLSAHLCARMMNYIGYDAGNMGNHDIEAGHNVYDRFVAQCQHPVLGANIINIKTGEPYLKPYHIIERDGIKIAILGMITPSIPNWLPQYLWKDLRFDDMLETAKKWIPVLKNKEKADIIIGLFHSGKGVRNSNASFSENAGYQIAEKVPGFDILLLGHDHRHYTRQVTNTNGDTVWIANPSKNAFRVADFDLLITKKKKKIIRKEIKCQLTDIQNYPVDSVFTKQFQKEYLSVKNFVSEPIGYLKRSINTRPAFFGPSAFCDLIHEIQLNISKADISFTAPLSFDTKIDIGSVHVRDLFKLYKYENNLYTMELSGEEIKKYLEYSYALWTNQMKSPDDDLLNYSNSKGEKWLTSFCFHYDSAAGIRYTVDVTQPAGSKIDIIGMADGTPFDLNKKYKVAINSYRANGGGGHLTKGAGIPADQISARIINISDKDLRYYLMEYIKSKGTITPKAMNHWKFIPEEWTIPASKRDYIFLFHGKKASSASEH